jgi:ribosomal protein S18 acetylase RimI-like enzyme
LEFMLIRDMTLEDCDVLEALWHEASLGVDPGPELGGRLTRAWVACATPSSGPLGYALGWWVVDELQLLGLGVLPTARRRGVGRLLLAHVLDAARAAGGRRVLLEVARGNAPALALYENAGFRVFNTRPKYYRATGDDALEMELAL